MICEALGALTFIYQRPGHLSLICEDFGPSLGLSVLLGKNLSNYLRRFHVLPRTPPPQPVRPGLQEALGVSKSFPGLSRFHPETWKGGECISSARAEMYSPGLQQPSSPPWQEAGLQRQDEAEAQKKRAEQEQERESSSPSAPLLGSWAWLRPVLLTVSFSPSPGCSCLPTLTGIVFLCLERKRIYHTSALVSCRKLESRLSFRLQSWFLRMF